MAADQALEIGEVQTFKRININRPVAPHKLKYFNDMQINVTSSVVLFAAILYPFCMEFIEEIHVFETSRVTSAAPLVLHLIAWER